MALPAKMYGLKSAPSQQAGKVTKMKLKKGDLLFKEGDLSKAMYLIQNGVLRIYKKKNSTSIEIDTIRSGQIVGELAFLDGNPRSASAEALTDCELTEISGPTFTASLSKMPEWIKILLKTVVGRLRAASTRIRQLEHASAAVDYSETSGKRVSNYAFLSTGDILKLCTALLLVASRNSELDIDGLKAKTSLLNRYAYQIFNLAPAKIQAFLVCLAECDLVKLSSEIAAPSITVLNADFIEQFIAYVNEQNLADLDKKIDVTPKAFRIMSYIVKYLPQYDVDEATGQAEVNLKEIMNAEVDVNGTPPFSLEDLVCLTSIGFMSPENIKSVTEVTTLVRVDFFKHQYKLQKVLKGFDKLNEQKRER
jgi:CRP/FNR family transcriptional regulator, cyclic AMP receptor protein